MLSIEELKNIKARCEYVVFENSESNYTIAKFVTSDGKRFSLKGNYFSKVGGAYIISGSNAHDPKYKNTFISISVKPDINLDDIDDRGLITYLSFVTSENIARRLVEGIPNIIEVIENDDLMTLQTIDGVGLATAKKIVAMHSEQLDFGPALIALSKYGLTEAAIKKIVKHYRSVEKAIQVAEDNIYDLSSINGFGFKRCDSMFLLANQENSNAVNDLRRVYAYIDYLFEQQGESGNTWLNPRVFADYVLEFVPEIDIREAISYINKSGKYMVVNSFGEKRITTMKYAKMELEVAKRLKDLLDTPSNTVLKRVDETIFHVETDQGFTFDDDQRKAINSIIESNVFLLQGVGGSGKSSVINGVSRVFRENNLTVAQTALSGKAADNLAQVTKHEGKTIHSLIKVGHKKPYDEENPMPYDVVVVDEVSMVNIEIFVKLLRAMKPGAKLIMLGDSGQLDSIGVAVMSGMMFSGIIPGSTLTKIHRQAQESAIITHSIAVRDGQSHSELKVKSNTKKRYGGKKDLEYIFTKNSEENTIYRHVLLSFKKSIDEYGIDNTQILCATKSAGETSVHNLNKFAQIAANPFSSDKEEMVVGEGDNSYTLRVGDRVINTKNNYSTKDINGVEAPIFNGNTGKILEIDKEESKMIVKFDGIGDVVIPTNDKLDSIQLGYAITIHKSQGSTIESVIVALPYHFLLNSRELLYTAMTRASKNAVIVTSPRTLRDTLVKTSKKVQQTNLDMYLRDYDEHKDKYDKKKEVIK